MEDYKARFISEYNELKQRTEKLNKLLQKYFYGELNFELNCAPALLRSQYNIMIEYLNILEKRAKIENIKLN